MVTTTTRVEPTFLELARFAADAYCWTAAQPLETITRECSAPGELTVYRGASVAAAVLQNSKRAVIAVPGSLIEPHDWVANFDARQINLPALGPVHFGFWVYADALWRNFLRGRAAKITTPIYMCGHSQGGAVAAIVAHYLARLGKPPRLIATFGSPRFLNAEAAQRYRLPLVSFRNAGDPVPLFPLGWWRSYASAGRTIRLESDGSHSEDQRGIGKSLHYLVRRLFAMVGWGSTIGPIQSHSITEYINRLQRRAIRL